MSQSLGKLVASRQVQQMAPRLAERLLQESQNSGTDCRSWRNLARDESLLSLCPVYMGRQQLWEMNNWRQTTERIEKLEAETRVLQPDKFILKP